MSYQQIKKQKIAFSQNHYQPISYNLKIKKIKSYFHFCNIEHISSKKIYSKSYQSYPIPNQDKS